MAQMINIVLGVYWPTQWTLAPRRNGVGTSGRARVAFWPGWGGSYHNPQELEENTPMQRDVWMRVGKK
jgi:hypothetical protein